MNSRESPIKNLGGDKSTIYVEKMVNLSYESEDKVNKKAVHL